MPIRSHSYINALATDSAGVARSLDYLGRLGLAPDQVAANVEEMRPAVEAGDGAAMLAALDQARAWWDAYDVAQRIICISHDFI